jgi:hypothetical protein
MAAAVTGLAPILPVIAEVWLPVSVIPVSDRITKLLADKRLTGAGPAASAGTAANNLPVAIMATKVRKNKKFPLVDLKIVFIIILLSKALVAQ